MGNPKPASLLNPTTAGIDHAGIGLIRKPSLNTGKPTEKTE